MKKSKSNKKPTKRWLASQLEQADARILKLEQEALARWRNIKEHGEAFGDMAERWNQHEQAIMDLDKRLEATEATVDECIGRDTVPMEPPATVEAAPQS